MVPPASPTQFPRREFILGGIGGAGLLGAAAFWAYRARRAGSKAAYPEDNPFAYEMDRYERTDPALVHYQETGRLRGLRAGARKLVVGADDQLYLAAGKSVCVLDAAGACRTEIALDDPARCLAVLPDGNVYVGLRDHVEVYNRQGERLQAWQSPGERSWLTGLAVGKETLFAADAGHRLVWRYDLSGKLLGRLGEKDEARNIPGFIVPSPYFDVEWHRDGLLRVANPGRHQVELYTADGDFEFSWGRASAGMEGFCGCCNPINLALLPDGRCVTCEKGLPRVKVYGVHGELQSVVAGPEAFPENAKVGAGDSLDGREGGLDAAVDSRGRIHVLDLVVGDIRIMTRKPGMPDAGGGSGG